MMLISVRSTAALFLLPLVSVVGLVVVLAARKLSALARVLYYCLPSPSPSPVALYYRPPRRKEEDEQEECVLCLSAIDEGSEVRELRCRHLFHRPCLDRWLLLAATCPLCRRRLTAAPAPWEEELDDQDSDSDMMLFMACVHSRSTWFWPS
ncbi:unnamed protein product [Urochloa decumbens]|uniref:RING-type domain-containing protein n=1 Tax=Urochloa decumbens TaxID=240449 RepID=A0ABC9F8T2_9POAL